MHAASRTDRPLEHVVGFAVGSLLAEFYAEGYGPPRYGGEARLKLCTQLRPNRQR
jgi:hypothetical protein